MKKNMTETVFISGAGKGLGFALARQFIRAGYHVFAGEHSPSRDLPQLLEQYPEALTILPLDISRMDSIGRAAELVQKETSALDILINNAAVYLEDKSANLEDMDLTEEYFQQTMNVNAFGPLRMVQQFLALLKNGQHKMIVNISSEAGSIADCGRTREFAYCMSKSALNMQSKILQNYLAPQGFKVLAIQPGWMKTDMGGPGADVDPDEPARAILDMALKTWQSDDIIYLDYHGNPLPW
jgi:NAD(P)-dependent dehydrogenase (short-subunit alcohol dehydrogenase family)